MKTTDAARGKWRGILQALGIDKRFLTGKHGPCPMCGGKDRWRWDNKDGSGSFFCSQCGAGDGFALLRMVKGWDFKRAAQEVDKVCDNVREEWIKPRRTEEENRKACRELWLASSPATEADPVGRYLAARNVALPAVQCLRYAAQCWVPGGGVSPAMLALVHGPDGKPVTIHRTYLDPEKASKADMSNPRALMPGSVPDGAAVRLSLHGERLGIAEGIETARAAEKRFGVPVWAAINATMLAKWSPPRSVKEVLIFGDNDPLYGGQAAAYQLAHKLSARLKLAVQVHIPREVGRDWADEVAA